MKPLRPLVVGLALLFFGLAPAGAQDFRCRKDDLPGGAFRLLCEPAAGPVATAVPTVPPTVSTPTVPVATPTAPPTAAPPPAPTAAASDCPTWASVGENGPGFCDAYRVLHAHRLFSATSGAYISLGSVLEHYEQLSSLLKINHWAPNQVLTVHLRYLAGRDPFTTFSTSHDGGETVRNALRQWSLSGDGRCPPDPARRAACLSRYNATLAPLTRGMTPAGP